jgi:phospholipid transport system transporter-binding protein
MAGARFTERGSGDWLLEGDLDFYTVPEVLAQARDCGAGAGAIRVDLKGVNRADSAGLALLLEWLRRAERHGCEISFVNVPEQLMSIARVCGLEGILPLSH